MKTLLFIIALSFLPATVAVSPVTPANSQAWFINKSPAHIMHFILFGKKKIKLA